jgi:ribosomal protein S18 acetylase RimI-like enzyme
VAKVRAFRDGDLDRCVELFVKVFSQEPWEDQWPSAERAQAYLSDIMGTPGFRGYVACEGRQILGMCFGHKVRWWSGDEYYLDELCVDSAVQRNGIGTQLVEYAKERLLKEGVQFIVLLTEKDTVASQFYAKQGFEASDKAAFMYNRIDGNGH